MRVLDIGCATGEVTSIIADIVGNEGEVVGIDISEDMIQMAKEKNEKENIQFIQSDIYNLQDNIGEFDAIVGRRILMYLPNVMDCLNKIKSHLKSGGILCFQESDAINGGVGAENLPMHQYAIEIVWQTIEREGGDIHIGQKLYSIFTQLGVNIAEYKAEADIQTSNNNDLGWLIDIMLPRVKRHQIVDESFAISNFTKKLQQESEKHQCAFIREMAFGIWGKVS